ncbi:lipoyl(octanoyl) transferase LipB [Clostridium sediminicola]|uniref:lipoyl(octanoyl) transferase LipB n=1 Tax=Clostridium sediminicola TaxID=3114879 RepID=UPI0031F1C965
MEKCYVIKFDRLIGYKEGLELQKRAFDLINDEKNEMVGIILIMQHKTVFTIGRNGGKENLLISQEKLEEEGIELYDSSRGGNITYHGPGQLVAYPLLNLNRFKKDIHWYVRQLEEVVIRTLKTYGIEGGRKPKYPGVWVKDSKITAIGVKVRRWITMHGLAFNIFVNKEHFRFINPCGITEFGIASLDDFVQEVSYYQVEDRIVEKFKEVFEIELADCTENNRLKEKLYEF